MKLAGKGMRDDSPGVIDSLGSPFPWDAVRYPGLTPGAQEIEKLAGSLTKHLAIFSYSRRMPCLWVAFLGGTGTGKSTIFNVFCGRRLSETGVERPKTGGPIAYAHRHCEMGKGFPFPDIEVRRHASDDPAVGPTSGQPGRLMVLDHDRAEWSHFILVDTPDLDSVEKEHRQFAEDMYLLSHAVIFVMSQEKYADEAPYLFLMRLIQEEKPYFLIVNKAEEKASHDEILETLGPDHRKRFHVAVFVEDAKGEVVRHLVAGALGDNPPPPLKPGLSQSLEWDGKADYGKPAGTGPFRRERPEVSASGPDRTRSGG